MSLTTVNLGETVKKQYQFKRKTYTSQFTTLVFVQLLAIFFSLNGTSGAESGGNGLSIDVTFFSANNIITLTVLWAFILGINLTTKQNREADYIFVTNRLSSNLSNIIFLLTASIIGAITAILSGYLLKLVLFIAYDFDSVVVNTMPISLTEYIFGILGTILIVFFASSLGYFFGFFVQMHKIFIVIFPAFFISILFLGDKGEVPFIIKLGNFYFNESSFLIFLLKIISSNVLLFTISVFISNKKEVRK